MSTKNPWFWELRGDGEFLPPNIVSIGDGWADWDGPLKASPSLAAEIFVRELIQNFVDAAREQKELTGSQEPPTLDFYFVEVTGTDAARIVEKLGLAEQVARFSSMTDSDRKCIRLGASTILNGNLQKLRFLVVVEGRTTGMYGPWEMSAKKMTRKMRSALLSTVGDKTGNGLGAYGEGKRAVIAASVPRTMFVYTRFANREDSGDTNRRLLGVTYWRTHSEGDLEATGLGLLGNNADFSNRGMEGRPTPFANEDADQFLTELGIPFFVPRAAGDEKELGTTHLFLEPVFDADEVRWAIERNWWPLLLENGAQFRVFDFDGSEIQIDPRKRPELAPFIECYEVSHQDDDQIDQQHEHREDVVIAKNTSAGVLALKADVSEAGWSWADRETNVNLVALIRDGMIIEYEKFPRVMKTAPPFVRGVFRTDHANFKNVAEQLRMVEPPLHNCFMEKGAGYEPAYMQTAGKLYSYIAEGVKVFRNKFKTTPPPNEDEYEDFGQVFDTPDEPKPPVKKPVKPIRKPRKKPVVTKDPWTNEDVSADLEVANDGSGQICANATRKISLKNDWNEDSIDVNVQVGWQILGDRGAWAAAPELDDYANIKCPPGFKVDGVGRLVGKLSTSEIIVTWTSLPYDPLWTVRPYLEISQVGI